MSFLAAALATPLLVIHEDRAARSVALREFLTEACAGTAERPTISNAAAVALTTIFRFFNSSHFLIHRG